MEWSHTDKIIILASLPVEVSINKSPDTLFNINDPFDFIKLVKCDSILMFETAQHI